MQNATSPKKSKSSICVSKDLSSGSSSYVYMLSTEDHGRIINVNLKC